MFVELVLLELISLFEHVSAALLRFLMPFLLRVKATLQLSLLASKGVVRSLRRRVRIEAIISVIRLEFACFALEQELVNVDVMDVLLRELVHI